MAYRFRDTTRRLRILFEFMGREISGTSTRCCGKKIELSTANFSERLDNVVWRCDRMRVTRGYLASGNPINAGCRDCNFVIKRREARGVCWYLESSLRCLRGYFACGYLPHLSAA